MIVEQAFLGTILTNSYLLKNTLIKPQHLINSVHQQLMNEMVELQQKGKSVDLLTMSTLDYINDLGGVTYLNELISYSDLEKFEQMEDLILERWRENTKKQILTTASTDNWEIDKVIQHLQKLNEVKIDDHISLIDALKNISDAPWQEKEEQNIATTGIRTLDEMTGGWQDGEVTIIAARPSMGKTDVMLHFAKQVGWAGYLPIIFSLEMPEKLLTTRLIASTGRFNRLKMRDPEKLLSEKQKNKWHTVIGELSNTNIHIFDKPGQSVPEIRAKIRKLMNEYPNKKPVVFIDYLTLIRASDTYGGNAHFQVTEISRNLKETAKEFQCPIICLAQLNRGVEGRANKRPLMSDIRESGSIEQDADIILFLYREKYYDQEANTDTLEMIIAKNRNGPVGLVEVKYNEFTGTIEEITDACE